MANVDLMLSNSFVTIDLSRLDFSFVSFIYRKKVSLYLDIEDWDPEIMFII